MRLIRFLLKFAFVCNLCFVAGQIIRVTSYHESLEGIIRHILVLGIPIAFPLNAVVCVLTAIYLLTGKIKWPELPPLLYVLNLLILVAQLIVNF